MFIDVQVLQTLPEPGTFVRGLPFDRHPTIRCRV